MRKTYPDAEMALAGLLQTRRVRKLISSYVGENRTFAEQYPASGPEIEFNPQGMPAGRIRAFCR